MSIKTVIVSRNSINWKTLLFEKKCVLVKKDDRFQNIYKPVQPIGKHTGSSLNIPQKIFTCHQNKQANHKFFSSVQSLQACMQDWEQ